MGKIIGEQTGISLFLLVMTIPAFVGGIVWLTTIDAKASAAQDELRNTRQLLEYYQKRLDSIDNRLSHIEGQLNK